jgi:ribosome-binding factor A
VTTRRTVRVAEAIRAELARLCAKERSLETMLLSIQGVEVTPDLRQAFVFVSSLNSKLSQESILSSLEHLRHHWQKEVGDRLRLKFTPRLEFRFDEAIERGDRVMEILTDLGLEERPQPQPKKKPSAPDG